MFQWSGSTARQGFCAGAILVAWLTSAARPAIAQGATGGSGAVLHRVFLRDGGAIVSFGEFARVGDRVIVSVPIGGTDTNPVLHVLTLPEGEVDWPKTNAYVSAARAQRYAATRGEADFAQLTRNVADTLYQAGLVDDPAKRLALVEGARRQLAEWPSQHFGYRADELAQMTTWLDQVVSQFRIAAGQTAFELALVARPPLPMVDAPLLPVPDLRQRAESGLLAASRASDPVERVALLRALVDTLPPGPAPGTWMAAVRTRADAELAAELGIDAAYATLSARTLARAAALSRRADVRGLERLVRSVLEQDRTLRTARPATIVGLLAALDAHVDTARRLRLARDAWSLRSRALAAYWRSIRTGLDRLLSVREWLTDVRQLAGPSPDALRRLAYAAEVAGLELARVQPPPEVAVAHSTLGTASGMAVRAAKTRLDALRSGSMDTAWQASSAAAGALLMLDRAVTELRTLTRKAPPAAPR